MKYNQLLSAILSFPSLMYGMDIQNLELEGNVTYNINQLTEVFVRDHQELFSLIPKEQHTPIVSTMYKNRNNLIDYVVNKKDRQSITAEEITKQYGEDALEYFKSYTRYGTALLSVMSEKEFTEDLKKKSQDKTQLKIAILVHHVNSLDEAINTKKSKNKNNKNNQSRNLEDNDNGLFLSDDIGIKDSLKNALCSQYANLYRIMPQFYKDEVLKKFINKHPNLVNEIIQKKEKNKKKGLVVQGEQQEIISSNTSYSSVIKVETLENIVLQNNKALTDIYEKYKVLKAMLESMGINIDAIQEAVNEDLQLIVDGLVEKIKNLNIYVNNELQKCCNLL